MSKRYYGNTEGAPSLDSAPSRLLPSQIRRKRNTAIVRGQTHECDRIIPKRIETDAPPRSLRHASLPGLSLAFADTTPRQLRLSSRRLVRCRPPPLRRSAVRVHVWKQMRRRHAQCRLWRAACARDSRNGQSPGAPTYRGEIHPRSGRTVPGARRHVRHLQTATRWAALSRARSDRTRSELDGSCRHQYAAHLHRPTTRSPRRGRRARPIRHRGSRVAAARRVSRRCGAVR